MRPVNLIPPEDRSGARRPMRGGPLAYIVVATLVAALVGVTAVVTTGNAISESEAEITRIEGEVSAAKARAEELSSYTEFHQVSEQRAATITSLANSRFDWERVMRELALIIPGNVWLTDLNAGATAGASEGESNGLRAGVSGPALTISGCASSQDAVAGFIQALKEIDGVTRVGMQQSALGGSGTASSGSSTTSGCQTRKFIAQFEMVVAFDAAPVAAESSIGEEVAPPATSTEGATTESTSESSGEG